VTSTIGSADAELDHSGRRWCPPRRRMGEFGGGRKARQSAPPVLCQSIAARRGGQPSHALRSLPRPRKMARPGITPIGPLINFNLPYHVAALSAGQGYDSPTVGVAAVIVGVIGPSAVAVIIVVITRPPVTAPRIQAAITKVSTKVMASETLSEGAVTHGDPASCESAATSCQTVDSSTRRHSTVAHRHSADVRAAEAAATEASSTESSSAAMEPASAAAAVKCERAGRRRHCRRANREGSSDPKNPTPYRSLSFLQSPPIVLNNAPAQPRLPRYSRP